MGREDVRIFYLRSQVTHWHPLDVDGHLGGFCSFDRDGTCSYGTTKVTISDNPSSCCKSTVLCILHSNPTSFLHDISHHGMYPFTPFTVKFTSYSAKREGYYLQPCPDCLLWIDTVDESGQTGRNIDMYSK